MTSNLREYQKILAFNLAIWINKFISNLNIHVAPAPIKKPTGDEGDKLGSFLPLSDYISCSSGEQEWCPDEMKEECEVEAEEEDGGYTTETTAPSTVPGNEGDSQNE